MPRVEVLQGDITTVHVDAVVNAANDRLAAGGGVCGAIFRAAGHDELRSACEAIGECATGRAVVTPSFRLADHGVRMIVHAVGPIWNGDASECDDLLARTYRSALDAAASAGARSIAFPAISTGIYGFPAERAAAIAVRGVAEHNGSIDHIVLVAFDAESAAILEDALDAVD